MNPARIPSLPAALHTTIVHGHASRHRNTVAGRETGIAVALAIRIAVEGTQSVLIALEGLQAYGVDVRRIRRAAGDRTNPVRCKPPAVSPHYLDFVTVLVGGLVGPIKSYLEAIERCRDHRCRCPPSITGTLGRCCNGLNAGVVCRRISVPAVAGAARTRGGFGRFYTEAVLR